jgi:methylated-DNA-[protein]-cysteine S-methyltransferase
MGFGGSGQTQQRSIRHARRRGRARYDPPTVQPSHFALFDTAIGPCAIAWSVRGVTALQLPEADRRATGARLRRRLPGALEADPPADVQRTIEAIVALLEGEPVDLADVVLDPTGVPDFHRRVYAVARTIAPGTTLTYGEVARRIGEPGAARAVGQALGRNPFAIIVPCHRVLAAAGGIGGFSAGGGRTTKRRMLAIERARPGDGPDLFAAAPDRPGSTA